jgi:predicted RecB family endonuclease
MIICSCTRCGCEATADTVALVEAMRWTVVGVRSGDLVQALCPACRRAPEGAASPRTARARVRTFEPLLRPASRSTAEPLPASPVDARRAAVR